MSEAKLDAYFFTALFIVALIVVCTLFYPFLGALAIALVLAILTHPFYLWVQNKIPKQNRTAAGLITVTIVTLAVLLPAAGLFMLLLEEVQGIMERLAQVDFTALPAGLEAIKERAEQTYPLIAQVDFSTIVQLAAQNIGHYAAGMVTETASLILKLFVTIIALYYFLKDGRSFVRQAVLLSPLTDNEDIRIIVKLKLVTHSLIRGSLVIAFLQGIMVGIGFLIFGIANPVLWGTVAAIGALLPTVGTGLVTIPAIVYLFYQGHIIAGIGLLAWSALIVGLVDNVIGPKLIGKGAHIHPLFILLSVLGGIALFGVAGFLLGPLIFGLLVALSEIYQLKVQQMHEAHQ
jgi:predicted PurR-regulated permease PerM